MTANLLIIACGFYVYIIYVFFSVCVCMCVVLASTVLNIFLCEFILLVFHWCWSLRDCKSDINSTAISLT